MGNVAIELRGITKRFGSVVANRDVNLSVNSGEILSLLGENGSGKTTLMNMISGIYFPMRVTFLSTATRLSSSPQKTLSTIKSA